VGRFSKTVAVWTALLAVGSATLDLSELRDGAAAMACCAKTDYSCSGMQAPDDCCRNMGHAATHQVPATNEKQYPVSTVMAISTHIAPSMVASISRAARVTTPFTRPHDPPHLHPFALLI
jgi:hypothetical protein